MKVAGILRRRFNYGKLMKWAALSLVVFTFIGFVALPPIVKSVLLKQLSQKLNREVSIKSVRINPFMLSVTVRGLEVKETDGLKTFASFDELYLNLQTMSIFRWGVIIKEIRLLRPYLHIVRNEDLSYNMSDLLAIPGPEPAAALEPAKKDRPLRFSLNNIQLVNAAVEFEDRPKRTNHSVTEASLAVPFVSNLPYYLDSYVQPAFSAIVNGHAVSFKGNTKPFVDSLETNIDINLKDLDIPYYLAYSPFPLDFRLVSAFFDTESSIAYVQYKDRAPTVILKGNSSIKKIRIDDRHGNRVINLPRLDFSISSSDLTAMSLHFSKITIESPEIDISLDKSGKLNLSALVPKTADKEHGRQAENSRTRTLVEADEIVLAGGSVTIADLSENRNFKTSLENIRAKVSRFSTSKDKKADSELTLQTDTKESARFTSTFSVEPLAAEGSLELRQIALKKYAPYYGKFMLFSIEDGKVGFSTKYSYLNTEKEPDIKFYELTADLKALRLRKNGEKEDFLAIPSVSVRDTSVDLRDREILIGDFATQKGAVSLKRLEDGIINIADLFPRSSAQPAPGDASAGRQRKEAGAEKPWVVTAKKITLDRYSVKVEDKVPAEPALFQFDQIILKGENISNRKNTRGRASLSLIFDKKGSLKANGTVGIEPVSAQIKVSTKAIPVMPAVPYVSDKIKIIVFDGSISSDGNLSVSHDKTTGLKASYKGTASINHFASVDKEEADDFLKWNSLFFSGMDISFNPAVIKINEVALSDFYARVIINADASINFQNIFRKEKDKPRTEAEVKAEAGDKAEAKAGTANRMVTIDKVTLQGGTVDFSDHYIKPNFKANMLEIGGRVTGLSSEETKMADVEVRGKLENHAPLEITGRINPLRDDLFVDLKISFKDMDLSPLTPYSSRYLGYVIEKGKLALNLQYLIEKRKLDAQNRILLDQFTLGSQVDSPDATKLPVKLAIALLKNRRGEINLDIPVTGQIDDPNFSLGRIIIKILLNLLVKAATSPFALLGALFGGGQELSYVEFDAGTFKLNEQGLKKIDTLIKALHDRPSLKLDIEGHVDTDADREGLKQYMFNRKVRIQKLKEMARRGEEAPSPDDIKIDPAEYEKYLRAAYKEEKFPKPRNIIGIAKTLPVPEMEKLMLTHTEVKEDDLRHLASQRALAIKDLLLKSSLVEQERIFLVEPKTLQPEKKENVKDSRVDFRLK